MLNASFPDLPWERLQCVGFDLDGTLYDEFDFIRQVYRDIVRQNRYLFRRPSQVLEFMLERWLEKGSSYNRLFEETCNRFAPETDPVRFVENALELFRQYRPRLELPSKNRFFLKHLSSRFDLFLVSDGPSVLQKNKFEALGLGSFFPKQRCLFTGDLGRDHYKPSLRAFEVLSLPYPRDAIGFFGDRDCDASFASAAGVHFQRVSNLSRQG